MSGSVVIRDPRETVTVRDDRVTVVAVATQGPQGPTAVEAGDVIASAGDLIVGDALGDPTTLAVGAENEVVVVESGLPAYGRALGVWYCKAVAEIQPALDAAAAAGGGTVQLAPGSYTVAITLTIDSNVWLRGAGVDATTLYADDDIPVITTEDFATHTGTNDTDSPVNFKISDLTIDGLKATNAGSNCYGVRIHGANFGIERVRVSHCNADGITSEWSDSAGPPTTPGMIHAMEARLIDVEVHDCDGSGVVWDGPHDSMWHAVILWANGFAGAWIKEKGVGTTVTASHSWGNDQAVAWLIEGGASFLVGCSGEGASTAQVLILSNDNQVIGGRYFRAGGGAGIYLGQTSPSSVAVAGNLIATKTEGFDDAGAPLVFDNSDGGNHVRLLDRTSTTAPVWTGVDNSDDYEVVSPDQTWRRARHQASSDFPGAISTKGKAGVPADGDLEWVRGNVIVVDNTNSRLYVRLESGVWRYAALT